ncbi:hypothetical protein PENFLA_c003G08424 [Penicillium flavigenum]|uniref:Saccharopine dehydrogenase NADP binding domain-containing protein n=1 Tax=Penicillium flavigenum TaxID=254877 RepID=A0A1V6TUX7_9EURO|nr:hypothetical protein PENFLA_c003G08424 [Penicillium flavigenum]
MPEKKRILVHGSGMVAPPCIEYLTRNPQNEVTVASRTLSSALTLASEFPRTQPLSLDVASAADLDTQVAAHDLVISLVSYTHHAAVIKSAIKGRTNVVTTSYVSAEMRALDDAVKEAGITVLNEVKEFYSYCGGLPAPECADTPLGFKFSWSPRGAILSHRNSASFLHHCKQVDIPATELMSVAKPYYVTDGYSFVAYPNRNSVPSRDFYNIPEAETVIRGSLRYKGNPEFIQALAGIGWLGQEEKSWLKPEITWSQIQQRLVNAPSSDESSLVARIKEVYRFPNEAESERIISGMRWLGLFSTEPASIKDGNIFDTICHQLAKLLGFKPGERDLVMLQHKFVVEWRDGKKGLSLRHC